MSIIALKPGEEYQLIRGGSFEHWINGVAWGDMKRGRGRASQSYDGTDGYRSLKLEASGKTPDNTGVTVAWKVTKPLPFKNGIAKLRINLDARAGQNDRLICQLNGREKC